MPSYIFLTIPHVCNMTDLMVPSLERPEYMYELRGVAENIVRERIKHSEVSPHTESLESYKPHAASDGVDPPLDAHPPRDEDSIHVGPAFHIPMTKVNELQDLPSQIDFDWQASAPPGPVTTSATARNLGEELDVVSTPASMALPSRVDENKFVEVSAIALEAVLVATQVEHAQTSFTPTTVTADATSA